MHPLKYTQYRRHHWIEKGMRLFTQKFPDNVPQYQGQALLPSDLHVWSDFLFP